MTLKAGLEAMDTRMTSGGDQWESVVRVRNSLDLSLGSEPASARLALGIYLIGRDIATAQGMPLHVLLARLILKAGVETGLLKEEESFLLPLYLDTVLDQ